MLWLLYLSKINEENIRLLIVVYNLFVWVFYEDGEGEEEKVNVGESCFCFVLFFV